MSDVPSPTDPYGIPPSAGEPLSSTKLRSLLCAVLRAQSTPDPFDDLEAHVAAVEAGPALLPLIRMAVSEGNWTRTPRPGEVAMLTAMMLIAHEIDEDTARDLTFELWSTGRCHPVFLTRMRSINRCSLEDFESSMAAGIPVFVAKSLRDTEPKLERVVEWIEMLPEVDLAGIRRFFVLPQGDLGIWGEYLHVLSGVTLIWRGPSVPSVWWSLLMQLVLFHEVGHHVNHELDRVDKAGAEDRADAYALRHLQTYYPFLSKGNTGQILAKISRTSAGSPGMAPTQNHSEERKRARG